MKTCIICVGRLKERYFVEAAAYYAGYINRFTALDIIEVEDEKCPESAGEALATQVLNKEGASILRHVTPRDYVIALAIEGRAYSTVQFNQLIQDSRQRDTERICFVIGGSLGLSAEVKKRAERLISFSAMTFPHQLMRIILLEQINRAKTAYL